MITARLYSDPNCPFCYALGERIAALGLTDRVQWCGVEHDPGLSVPMARSDALLAAMFDREVAGISASAPEVAIRTPRGKPNTALAIEWSAALLAADRAVGTAFVEALYRHLWVEGGDLSDPGVLAALADKAGAGGAPDVTEEHRDRVRQWRAEWTALGRPGVPQLVRHDGAFIYGLATTEEIARLLELR